MTPAAAAALDVENAPPAQPTAEARTAVRSGAARQHDFSKSDPGLVAVLVPAGRLGLELQAGPGQRGALLHAYVPANAAGECSPVEAWSERRRAAHAAALVVTPGMQLIGMDRHDLLDAPYAVIVALLKGLAGEAKTLWWSSTVTASRLLQQRVHRYSSNS